MKIQSVRIKNFRALKDVTIPFDSVTTFIGPNGAGKSTVLRALDWYFNGKPGSLSADWTEWDTACKNIEAAAGICLAKNQLAYRTATLKAQGAVPEMLMQILAKAESK